MATKSRLIAAGFSAHLGVEVKSESDAQQHARQNPGQVDLVKVKMSALFSHSHDVVNPDGRYTVKVFGQEREQHQIDPNQSVKDIKEYLASKVGIHPSCQKIISQGKHLQDDQSLAQQNVFPGTMSLAWGPKGGAPVPSFYIEEDDMDPQFDYDFTNRTDDGTRYERGGYVYSRPYGWNRTAIKVLGCYPGGDVWLGVNGIRTESSSGEWAVSYHGTAAKNIKPISDGGYDTDKSQRQRHGPGIYSTPSPDVASTYATQFSDNGIQYEIMLQNRVNLKTTNVISADITGVGAAYFVTPNAEDIRPYGVCIKFNTYRWLNCTIA